MFKEFRYELSMKLAETSHCNLEKRERFICHERNLQPFALFSCAPGTPMMAGDAA